MSRQENIMWYELFVATPQLYSDTQGHHPARQQEDPLTTIKQSPNNTSKETNPKEAIGSNKLPMHLWPTTATAYGCIGLMNGAGKYGRTNWRHAGVTASTYYDALRRHLDAWWEGEEVDPDDGVPHLSALLAGLAIVVDAISTGNFEDDRAYKIDYRKTVDLLTPHVQRLKELHKDKNPKHFTIRDNGLSADAT
jgi:Domain of unknown function (DUF5664)